METLTVAMKSIEEQENFAVDEIEFEDTSRQMYLGSGVPVRVWNVTTKTLTLSDMQTLRTFHGARRGGFEAFYWVCPLDGVTYTVRFVNQSFKVTDVDSLNWRATFGLRTN